MVCPFVVGASRFYVKTVSDASKHFYGMSLVLPRLTDNIAGPALMQARVIASAASPVVISAGSTVATVAANLLPYAPTALVAVAAAGLITVAIFQAQVQASRINDADQARQWQMAQCINRDIYGPQPGVLRLPSMFPGVADLVLSPSTGYGSADQVSDQLIQNYLRTAFQAKGTGLASDISRAWTQLQMIQNAASQASNNSDW